MTAAFDRLHATLHRLFRLDAPPELDFGVYRLINLKRAHLTTYLQEGLPQQVAQVLRKTGQADRDAKLAALARARQRIVDELGAHLVDADGKLDPSQESTIPGKAYLRAQEDAASLKDTAEMEEEIFDRLATFFGRYDCGGGDIVPLRRYSSRAPRYAIPHDGEEVLLHWANRGQHYIKSAAYHPSMAIKLGSQRFVLRITDVRDIPRDNNKDAGRYLLPQIADIAKDDQGDILIPFTFRTLSKKEQTRYAGLAQGVNGNGNGGKVQSGILAEALEQLTQAAAKNPSLAPLLAGDAEDVPAFLHHVGRFVRRNNADFFIHRDLRGFLNGELEFYLKNETLDARDLTEMTGGALATRLVASRATRELGMDIIDALAQWEDLQKALWEKRKFVLQTDYFVPLGKIPNLGKTKLLEAIAGNERQWAEWQQLGLSGGASPLFKKGSKLDKRIAWLKENPSLPVDTSHFAPEFKDQLLEQFTDLDAATDGLLIHGDNWQALNLLQETYRGQVQCIHIDPPYNTDTSGFLYKNGFRHSSWLAMMEGRISVALPLMAKDGAFLCHIDEHEYERLHLLFECTPTENAGTLIWDKQNPMLAGKGLAMQHEYVLWRTRQERSFQLRSINAKAIIAKAESFVQEFAGINDQSRQAFAAWIDANQKLSGGERAYRHLNEDGRVYQSVAMVWPNPSQPPEQFFVPLMHPVTGKPCPVPAKGWSQSPEKMESLLDKGEIIFGKDESVQPRRKIFLTADSRRQVSSVLRSGSRGSRDMQALGLDFSYCHPVAVYEDILGAAAPESADVVLDHFAGSGTTAHAVMNLNREDGGQRKFALVEAGSHFDSTLVPRVKKLVFSADWKDGKPTRPATTEELERGPCLVKHQRIESYEDALANIRFEADGLDFGEGEMPYTLQWDSKGSPTWLLHPEMDQPFDYPLELMGSSNGNGESARTEVADLPETFAYLLGLRVQTRRVVMDGDRRYLVQRGSVGDKSTVVLWRNVAGWQEADHQREQDFIAKEQLLAGADQIFLNGCTTVQQADSLNSAFARRMFAEPAPRED